MSNDILSVLGIDDVILGCRAASMEEAIDFVGGRLVARGSVEPEYIAGMQKRETVVSTFLGNGVALPHGVHESMDHIINTGIVVAQYPDGVDWGMGAAHLVVGLAAAGDDHVAVLSQLAEILMDEELCEQMWATDDPEFIHGHLTAGPEDPEED